MSKFNLDAQGALKQIRDLILEVNNLKTSLKNINQANQDSFTKLENGLKNVKDKTGLLANKMNHLEAILKKNTTSTNVNTAANNKNAASKKKQATETDKATKKTKKNTEETKKGSKAISGMTASVGALLRAFGLVAGVQLFAKITEDVYKNIKTFDSLNFAMEKITKTNFNFENSQRFLLQITKDFGVELVTTSNRWIKFLAAADNAGLSLRETENIFRSMTKASAVLGLDTAELTGVYLALEQMLSKGKVTTEELRRQLGERLPGAMGIMAASIGKTIPELDKMLKLGQVLSAEVLPGFAKAVELAYGIENVDRVDTLVAAQNRLTASWQLFIKNVSEGDSVLKKFFGGVLQLATETIEGWDRLLRSADQDLRFEIGEEETLQFKELERSFSQYLEFTKEVNKQTKVLTKERNDIVLKLSKVLSEEERKELDARLLVVRTAIVANNKEVEDAMIAHAEKNLDISELQYNQALTKYEDFKKKVEAIDKDTLTFDEKQEFKIDLEQLEELRNQLIITTAKYNIFRKLVEKSQVQILGDDELKTTQRRLRNVKDLTLEIQNEIAKAGIEHSKEVLKNEESSIEEKLQAIQNAANQELLIASNIFKIKKRDAEKQLASELKSIQESENNGRVSAEKAADHRVAIEKEKNQKIELAAQVLQNRINQIQANTASKQDSVGEQADNIELSRIEDIYNKRIIIIKKEYEASAKSTEDKIALEKKLKAVVIEMTNAIIDTKIKLLETTIANKDADSEYVKEVVKQINALKASKKDIVPDDDDEQSWKDFWDNILDYASEFNNAVGGIFDSIFERRIENINAEIQAERDKYDALILLARDDDEERQTLERNRDARIKELEKKRLKQQQKQARAKKAFAISNIAIDTAQAIMSIWSDFPKFDFGISAGLTAALVGALGAAQIATVLAQPIPKYKDGTTATKKHTGMINDGIWQEYIETRDGIMTTKRKNAIVNLEPGDTVYKNYDEMVRKSSLLNAMTGGASISQFDFNRVFLGIEDSISNGFKKSKIINKNSVLMSGGSNDGYKESMSRWNS